MIDWSWYTAKRRVRGAPAKGDVRVPQRWPEHERPRRGRRVRYSTMLYPHVMFSHVIAHAGGSVLFIVGLAGQLGPI